MRSPHYSPPCLNPLAFGSNPGTPVVRIFEPCFDGRTTVLRQIGTKNIQQEMDALARYCDIDYMLNQLSHGDTSCLSSSQPMYGDFSGMPDNPADVLNLVNGAAAAFGRLSASDRALFNNDWRVWFASSMQAGKPVAVANTADNPPTPSTDHNLDTVKDS